MKDRYGLTMSELTTIQTSHLDTWKQRLTPTIFSDVSGYVVQHNRSAADEQSAHRVYRGSELASIVFWWPNLPDPYPKIKHDDRELI